MTFSNAADDIDDDEGFIVDIDSIQAHGVGAADITKLKANGYYTTAVRRGYLLNSLLSVHSATRRTLLKIKGFSEVKVEKIKEAIQKCQPSAFGFITAQELGQQRRRVVKISTGSKQLDSILGGGFQSMSISEVVLPIIHAGLKLWLIMESRSMVNSVGVVNTEVWVKMLKAVRLWQDATLSHNVRYLSATEGTKQCCNVDEEMLTGQDMGGAEGKVAYIDTEGTFRPERIAQIAERFGMDPEQAQENIAYARALNSEHQLELLNALSMQFASNEYRLLIIDSIMNCFRVDYCGRGELADRQQKLNQFLSKLAHMAEEFNVCVLMTNQVQSDPGANALFAGADGRKPVGGHILAHASTTRVLLRKGRGEERVAKIQDSPDCPEREATYIITTGGINDPEKV
ncbi:MAG: hypothetical protein M1812_003584 [Candelaria pacifica]|nr:MAG: hypothetical protein M1812_003584 [Candelaria pacifica]